MTAHEVFCIRLQKKAEGLSRQTYPGALGKKIFDNVSNEAWQEWLRFQTMLINEHRIMPMDPNARKFLEEQMDKFFFGEGVEHPKDFSSGK